MCPAVPTQTPLQRSTKYIHCTAKEDSSDSEDEMPNELKVAKVLTKVPDQGGRRFCRVCNDFLPITDFPRGQRRFTCRSHLWERIGKKAKKKLLMKPCKRLLARLWMQSYKDRRVFGHSRIALRQADIDTMIDAAEITQAGQLAVIPINPSQILSVGNAVLASKQARRELIARVRSAV